MQPKWQKAKFVEGRLLGKEVWVRNEPPILIAAIEHQTGMALGTDYRVTMAVIPKRSSMCMARAIQMERLAEFANEVRYLTWEELESNEYSSPA